jgi:hypothetical protein
MRLAIKKSSNAGRYSHARIGVKIVCDVDVRMSQRLACRVNTMRSIYQAAEFLAKRVKRFLLDNALEPQPCAEPLKLEIQGRAAEDL